MLPPLTFYEFLKFVGESDDIVEKVADNWYVTRDIEHLNSRFIEYLNYGGYPEAVLNEQIRSNPEQFIRNDIIDKVLLKDLPSLYGIQEIQELNKLFSFLAYNAGGEASLENISQGSGITKPTIKRYIEYLESAFLIMKLSTVDDNCRTMTRERNFKVYLSNPSMRAALFAPVEAADSDRIGHLAECAIFSQWQHSPAFGNLRYARWRNEGEVDIVLLGGPLQKPVWIGEIKWSDRIKRHGNDETKHIQTLLRRHASISTAIFTTKTYSGNFQLDGRNVIIMPSALYCYTVGRNITAKLETLLSAEIVAELPAVLQTLPPVREDIEHEYNEDDQL
jgi:predicted AAA+ superfamily ATPase